MPSFSAIIALSLGLLASNNSATLGSPPVISFVFEVSFGSLANLDQVAYVRFASVYRNFKEAKDFEQFIGNLNVYKEK